MITQAYSSPISLLAEDEKRHLVRMYMASARHEQTASRPTTFEERVDFWMLIEMRKAVMT